MKILEKIFEHEGIIFKITNDRIYCQVFGTTIDDHSMHYSWSEIKKEIMTESFKELLKQNNLL
jgi:hypothetical protein